MATPGQIAKRSAEVHERVGQITDRLRDAYGLDPAPPIPPAVRKHNQLRQIAELEQFADVVEAGLGAALNDLTLLKQENAELRAEVGRLRGGAPTVTAEGGTVIAAVEVEMPGIDDLVRYAADQYAVRTGADVPRLDVDGIAEVAIELWRDGWSLIGGSSDLVDTATASNEGRDEAEAEKTASTPSDAKQPVTTPKTKPASRRKAAK